MSAINCNVEWLAQNSTHDLSTSAVGYCVAGAILIAMVLFVVYETVKTLQAVTKTTPPKMIWIRAIPLLLLALALSVLAWLVVGFVRINQADKGLDSLYTALDEIAFSLTALSLINTPFIWVDTAKYFIGDEIVDNDTAGAASALLLADAVLLVLTNTISISSKNPALLIVPLVIGAPLTFNLLFVFRTLEPKVPKHYEGSYKKWKQAMSIVWVILLLWMVYMNVAVIYLFVQPVCISNGIEGVSSLPNLQLVDFLLYIGVLSFAAVTLRQLSYNSHLIAEPTTSALALEA